MSEQQCPLGDVLTLQRGFDITKADQELGDVPVVSSSGVNSFHNKAMVSGPGVVIGRKGTLGTCFYIDRPFWPHDTTLWVKDFKGNSSKYCYYLLLSMNLAKYDVGAANPTLNRNQLHLLPVVKISLDDQRRIASILGAYDDLIEVNRRRVALLEDMARSLFEEWFVRFRFPGCEAVAMVETPDGPLPEGWANVPIRSAYDGLYDGPHATPPPASSGPIFLGIGNVSETGRLDLGAVRHIADEDYAKWTKRVTPSEGDVVFTYEATLNRYALIPKGFRGCLGRRLALIRTSSKPGMNRFLYLYFFTDAWRAVIAKNTLSGATVDRVPLSTFPEFPITLPPGSLIGRFDPIVEPIFEQLHVLEMSNRILIEARDLLLPRLISGQLPVAAAERELEEAA